MRLLLALALAAAVAAPVAAQDKAKALEKQDSAKASEKQDKAKALQKQDKPKSLAELKGCVQCHGEDGNTPQEPDYPKLGGQHYDYLLHSLKAYKSGLRKNPIMQAMAKPLSTREMEELARYYAAQHSTLHVIPLHRLARDER